MSGLTMPVESKILGPDGKPFETQQPVSVDRECSYASRYTTTVYLTPKLKDGETYEEWAGRCGRIDHVGTP
jgi:hypothetical protein